MAKKVRLLSDGNGVAIQGALHPTLVRGASALGAVAVTVGPIVGEIVRLCSTGDCHIRFSSMAPHDATATDLFLPARVPEYFATKGLTFWLSVIQDGAAVGNLYYVVME